MSDESGSAGIAKGIRRTLDQKMWTGNTHGWQPVGLILLGALKRSGAAQCCPGCEDLLTAAFTVGFGPSAFRELAGEEQE